MSLSVRRLVVSVVASVFGVLVFASAPALAAVEAPQVSVQLPVSATSATVHGVLDPGREGGPGTFELGRYEFLYSKASKKTGCRGEGKAPASPAISMGGGKEEVSETLSGLEQGTEYAVCLLASNEFKEEAVSLERSFRTESPPEAPDASGLKAEPVSGTSETLRGVLNPKKTGETGSYEFMYRPSSSECQGEGEEKAGGEAHGAKEEAVSNEVGGLRSNTQYAVCLLARNEAGETALSSPVSFTTSSQAPSVSGESVSGLGATSATVTAQVNPGGLETTYTVQYGPTTGYGLETSPVTVPENASTLTVTLTGLQQGAEYHVRFLVENKDGSQAGADLLFTTYLEGSSGLPDGRAYEMVTPPGNYDANVHAPSQAAPGIFAAHLPFKAAANGDAVAYAADPTTGGSGTVGNTVGNQYVATRLPQGGWTQVNVGPLGDHTVRYQAFSEDLSTGVFASQEQGSSQYENLFTRSGVDGNITPFFTVTPPYRRHVQNAAQEYTFFSSFGAGEEMEAPLVFAGASSDFTNLLFEANDDLLSGEGALERELNSIVKTEADQIGPLEDEAERLQKEQFELEDSDGKSAPATEGKRAEHEAKEREIEALGSMDDRNELYMSVGGSVSLVNVSPEGKVVPGATFGGARQAGRGPDFSHVISADGSRVFWSSVEFTPSEGWLPKAVFVRVNGSRTIKVSPGPAYFWTASADGRYAFYTEAGKLWRFDVEDETRTELAGSAGGVQGVIAVNETGEDGAYVYFVAHEALTGVESSAKQAPVDGGDNLYAEEPDPEHAGQQKIVFIGTLSSGDSADWARSAGTREAEANPDGMDLVFMSSENLTGHPYTDEGVQEVYVFDARDGSLFCVSCRAQGSGGLLHDTQGYVSMPRWISEDGDRVFFDSEAPLVWRDIDGTDDVYEWERDGSGECDEASGCVYLISGGREAPAQFIDASENGNDVFFATRQRLSEMDGNENVDLYDARVGGVEAVSAPVCSGTSCQGVPAPPPVFATPASVTFTGVGNFPPPATSSKGVAKSKVKTLTRAQKLEQTLRNCRRRLAKKSKKKACEVRARRLYGGKAKGSGSQTSGRRK